jgi:hypothetical protein
MALRLKLLQQAAEHSLYFTKLGFCFAMFSGIDHVQVMYKKKKILKFAGGAHRHVQELTKFGPPSLAVTFCNIGRHRARRAPNLASEPKAFFHRKQARKYVDTQGKLPNLKLSKVRHARLAPYCDRFIVSYLKLNTNHLIRIPYEVSHAA